MRIIWVQHLYWRGIDLQVKLHMRLLLVFVLFKIGVASAQVQVIQFYFEHAGVGHEGYFFKKPAITCQNFFLFNNAKEQVFIEPEFCKEISFDSKNKLLLYQGANAAVYLNPNGNLDILDTEKKKWIVGVASIDATLLKESNQVLWLDLSRADSMVVFMTHAAAYRLGVTKQKPQRKITLSFNDIDYRYLGLLNTNDLELLSSTFQLSPANGIVIDSLIFNLHYDPKTMKESYTIHLLTLQNLSLKVYADIRNPVYVIHRENMLTGTYRYKVMYANRNEISSGMFHFKDIPPPELDLKFEIDSSLFKNDF